MLKGEEYVYLLDYLNHGYCIDKNLIGGGAEEIEKKILEAFFPGKRLGYYQEQINSFPICPLPAPQIH